MSKPAFPRTAAVDRLVLAAAQNYLEPVLPVPFALLAVGGYGRAELFPCSDVDLILLLRDEPRQGVFKEPLSRFLSSLWDSSMKASHSVRTVDECCRFEENNPHLSISLLDVRLLYGDPGLFATLSERLRPFFLKHRSLLLRNLTDLTTSRHAKFGHTVYHLEPNIKDGPGGIRDYHLLHWAALLDPQRELFRNALADAEAARDFLYALRFFLHEQSGRDNNLLSFELQDEAAGSLAPEVWMRDFYRHARCCLQSALQVIDSIHRRESGLVRQFLDRRDKLSTAAFTVSHNQVFLRNPGITLQSIDSIFELFVFVGRQGIPVSWDTLRRLRERARTIPPETMPWPVWRSILSQPHASVALRNMHDAGVLAAVLPAWRTIESLVVRDFYHRYTVDEHTLVALEAIDALSDIPPVEHNRFSDLSLEENDLATLRLALLLHDIGKGTRPGEHVRGSAESATAFLCSIGVPENERDTIGFLIANHLLLSEVMTGRDLDDPATAHFLSTQVSTYENLRKLTLLTYADVSAVNPTAFTPWRSEQLWRVHSAAAAQLTRELASERIAPYASGRPANDFLTGFPTRYLRIHSAREIEEHCRLEEVRRAEGVALALQSEPGAYALTVLASDHPGLFAALCGALASFGMNIVKAEAASNTAGIALDEFRFSDPSRTLELNPEETDRLRSTVERVVKGQVEAGDLLRRRRPAHRALASAVIRPAVRFDNSASDSATLLHFTGEDRPGLLFDLASTLTAAGCNIELVLVDTEGRRARDVFYVTQAGSKLDAATQTALQAKLAPGS